MFAGNLIAASIVAMSALAATTMGNTFDSSNFRCISSPSDELREISKSFAQEAAVGRISSRRAAQEIGISVYVHIVASSKNETDGYLSVSRIPFFLLRVIPPELLYLPLPTSSYLLSKAKETDRMRQSIASYKF